MPSKKTVALPWTAVYAKVTTLPEFHPSTFWMSTSGIQKLRSTIEARVLEGDIKAGIAYQTADVENNPDNATLIGSYKDSNGVLYPTAATDVSSTFAGKQLVRFGFFVVNASTTAANHGRVSGLIDLLME